MNPARRHVPRLLVTALLLTLAVPFTATTLGQGRPASPTAPQGTPLTTQQPTDLSFVISGTGGKRFPIAIPPAIAPLNPELQGQVVDPFHSTLTDDLGGSNVFLVAEPGLFPKGMRPPVTREQGDAWIVSGAQFLLDTEIRPGPQITVVVHLYDLKTLKSVLDKTYTGEPRTARQMAHFLANDLVRWATGKPGPFLTKIAFSSDRDAPGFKEIYLMDFDGENQRRVTNYKSLSLAPDWSADSTKIVFQTYIKGPPGISIVMKEGGERRNVPVPTQLNASPSFSPDGKSIAYCGSVKGNPEIFVAGIDGSNVRRLTDSPAIDSTPRWTPSGRELAFTSNRQGSPQIYLMDLEGTNVRRLTFAGNWSDEASFSPDGSKIAFACRNEGDFQICIQDLLSARTVQISNGPGAHENPTWSPDGSKLAWELTRGNSTQIIIAGADGSNAKAVTSQGNNFSPAWSKSLE
ncbi:MAG: hypothetical protein ABIT01_18805 [Thermoanaerobaculia bacterium]